MWRTITVYLRNFGTKLGRLEGKSEMRGRRAVSTDEMSALKCLRALRIKQGRSQVIKHFY